MKKLCFLVAVALLAGCAGSAQFEVGSPARAVADAMAAGNVRALLPEDGHGNPDNPRLSKFFDTAKYPTARVVAVTNPGNSVGRGNMPALATVWVAAGGAADSVPIDLQKTGQTWEIALGLYD